MNRAINDKGEHVILTGAPGSLARARVERPALIEQITRLRQMGINKCFADEELRVTHHIKSSLERGAILLAAGLD